MSALVPKGILERGAANDLWRHTLSQIPAVFGRMVYLSGLRNGRGRYEHHGLALIFDENEADKAMRKTHIDAFNTWLNFSLEQQKADLDLYLAGDGPDRGKTVEFWIRTEKYRFILPASAREMEKKLFLADIESLLRMIANEYGVSCSDPDA
jgi:hypothetical protein